MRVTRRRFRKEREGHFFLSRERITKYHGSTRVELSFYTWFLSLRSSQVVVREKRKLCIFPTTGRENIVIMKKKIKRNQTQTSETTKDVRLTRLCSDLLRSMASVCQLLAPSTLRSILIYKVNTFLKLNDCLSASYKRRRMHWTVLKNMYGTNMLYSLF